MLKKLPFLFIFMFFGCSSIKVTSSQNDDSLLIQRNARGELWLSSLNSSQQIEIISQKQNGDTLFISYRRGGFLSPNNILPLTDGINFMKCANRFYKVTKTKQGWTSNILE